MMTIVMQFIMKLLGRRQQIKMQFLYLHFKHPNILCTLDELSQSIFFSGVYITRKTSEMKKLVWTKHLDLA